MEIIFEETCLRIHKNGQIFRKFKNGYKLAGTKSKSYLVININKKMVQCHRLVAMVYFDLDIYNLDQEVNHIDEDRCNNNVNNLRLLTHQQVQFNINAKGYWEHGNGWQAQLRINGLVYTKCYKTEEECKIWRLQMQSAFHII